MHPITFILNIIIILFSIIVPQVTVVVSCGHWDNYLHCHFSLHPDNSQLIFFSVGYRSSVSGRKQKNHLYHLAPCCLCFISASQILYSVSALHHVYCSVSALHHVYFFISAPCILFFFSLLQLFHYIYCEAIGCPPLWYSHT